MNNYQINKLDPLGSGSFSTVYKAVYTGVHLDIPTGTEVAVKVITLNKASSQMQAIIEDELRIIQILQQTPHPNLVEFYEVIKTDTQVCIIMELCDSGNLANILQKAIKEKYIQFYFAQLVAGLQHLEKNNIVHRDIKPRNLLLSNNRRTLKIADFGFAKQSGDDFMNATLCGSPYYMSPEILNRQPYNNQTDLWSIGMILFEMFYGYHPYSSCKSIGELQIAMQTKPLQIPPENTQIVVSESGLELLRCLLQTNVKTRITWHHFFNHPWVNVYTPTIPMTEAVRTSSLGSLGSIPSRPTVNTRRNSIQINDNYISMDDQMIFEIEMDDGVRSLCSVVDQSCILDDPGYDIIS